MEQKFDKIEIVTPIKVERKTKAREKAVAALEFPEAKQPDLLYFSAVLVSSGENLNHAYFLPSELLKAESTIKHKAVDKEHVEEAVIGHIYDRAYLDKQGNILDLEEVAKRETATIEDIDMDIAVAGIVYKTRFPKEAEEIKNGDWYLSMEAYFSDFDIKIGNVMIPRKDAEAMGISYSSVGKEAQVLNGGEVIASGKVARVLRNIIFCGCGIVKNPANPSSVFLEAANLNEEVKAGEVITMLNIKDKEAVKVEVKEEMASGRDAVAYPDNTLSGPGGNSNDTTGQCFYFKRFDDAGAQIDMCGLYNKTCTSALRETSDPSCLYNIDFMQQLAAAVDEVLKTKSTARKTKVEELDMLVKKAEKFLKK